MFTVDNTLTALKAFASELQEHKAYLSDLDTPIGDGNHGFNMSRGAVALEEALNEENFENVSDIFKTAAKTFMSQIGGASGPLYGTAMLEMAKASQETAEPAPIIEAGLKGIQKRGQATTGDKTMIDVWEPVVEAIQKQEISEALIDEAVQATEPLRAKKGRASYLGDRSVGHIDPGAMSSGYLFKVMLKAGVFDE